MAQTPVLRKSCF